MFYFLTTFSVSPGCPEIHSVKQTGLKLRESPPSTSWVLGLKTFASMAWHNVRWYFLSSNYAIETIKMGLGILLRYH